MTLYKIQSTYTFTLTQFLEANNINEAQELIDQSNSQLDFGDLESIDKNNTLELLNRTIETQKKIIK
jgi:hypothetical protein